jgi:hypothetical protein
MRRGQAEKFIIQARHPWHVPQCQPKAFASLCCGVWFPLECAQSRRWWTAGACDQKFGRQAVAVQRTIGDASADSDTGDAILRAAKKSKAKKPRKRPASEPEVLKIEGNWKDAMRKLISKKRPVGGWPKEPWSLVAVQLGVRLSGFWYR